MSRMSPLARWLRTKWLGSKWLRSLWGRIFDSPRRKWRSRPPGRLLCLEPLEDRTMLSVSVTVTGSDVKFTDALVTDDLYLQTTPGPNAAYNLVQWTTDPNTVP